MHYYYFWQWCQRRQIALHFSVQNYKCKISFYRCHNAPVDLVFATCVQLFDTYLLVFYHCGISPWCFFFFPETTFTIVRAMASITFVISVHKRSLLLDAVGTNTGRQNKNISIVFKRDKKVTGRKKKLWRRKQQYNQPKQRNMMMMTYTYFTKVLP